MYSRNTKRMISSKAEIVATETPARDGSHSKDMSHTANPFGFI
jgi:hypothetical protein